MNASSQYSSFAQRSLGALALVGLVACGTSPPEGQQPRGSAPPEGDALPVAEGAEDKVVCDLEHRHALRAEMLELCSLAVAVASGDPPMSSWGGAPSTGGGSLWISVDTAGVRVFDVYGSEHEYGRPLPIEQQPKTKVDDLPEQLKNTHSAALKRNPEARTNWSLEIDADVSKERAASVLRTLVGAGFPSGHILARIPSKIPPPRDPTLYRQLTDAQEDRDYLRSVEAIQREVQARFPDCEFYKRLFEVSNEIAGPKCSGYSSGLAEGLSQCGCDKEDAVLTIFYVFALGQRRPQNPVTSRWIEIATDGEPLAGDSWGEIIANLPALQERGPLRLSPDVEIQ